MIKPLLSIITGVLECLMCAGLIFGWSSLSSVLIKEKYFGCATTVSNPGNATNISLVNTSDMGNFNDTDLKCSTQQESLNFVFAIASSLLCLSTILNGSLFDRFGTFYSRLLASFMFLTASILMIISTPLSSNILYVAMCLYAVGGNILIMTNIQLGNLYFHARSSIITLLNGALDSSSFMFLLIKLVSDSGISLSSIFIGIACLTVFQIIRTFFLMPYKFIPFPLPKGKKYNYGFFHYWKTRNQNSLKPSTQLDELNEEKAPLEEEEEDLKDDENQTKDFKQCLRDVSFWLNCVQLSLLQLRCYFYFATVFFQLESIVGVGNTSYYLNVFGTCQLIGIFTAPLNGLLIDRLTANFSKTTKSDLIVRYKAVGCSSLLTTCLGVVFSIACAIPNIHVQYVTFVLQVVFRSFLYGGNSNYIATFYPGKSDHH